MPVDSQEPLESVSASCDLTELKPAVKALDTEGIKFALTLTPPKGLTARTLEGNVVLTPIRRGGEKTPTRPVNIAAEVAPDAAMEPPGGLRGRCNQAQAIDDMVPRRPLADPASQVASVTAH